MSTETIKNFLKEMTELSGEYIHYWEDYTSYSTGHYEEKFYISSNLQGFGLIAKETKEELIQAFDLIREQVKILCKSRDIKKKIDCKLLGVIDYD